MEMINKIKSLITQINEASDAYYNRNHPIMSDYEFDQLFDELKYLEKQLGVVYPNSPTQTVGYEVKSSLDKIKHSHPMLSLDKTKSVSDLIKFAGMQECVLSLKMDGLTALLTYENGELIRAETRGNGEIGEDITHNAKVIENIPLRIDALGHIEVEGEVIITQHDFDQINSCLPADKQYKNPRNLASGSIRQLDSKIAAERHLKFIAWKAPQYDTKMVWAFEDLQMLGFDVVPYKYRLFPIKRSELDTEIEELKQEALKLGYPIDGLVMTYNDIKYGQSLGMTGHHPKHSIAYKFYDEEVETTLLDIEWTMGKTGVLTPTAIFEPVEIDGTTVERASLHNISVMKNLGIVHKGQTVYVYKANMIIPQIASVDRSLVECELSYGKNLLIPPYKCPICSEATKITKDGKAEILTCTNPHCKGKLLGKLTHFCSKEALNIDGLSEATLQRFIELGFVDCYEDIFNLSDNYGEQLVHIDGFGRKSVDRLLNAIEKSKYATLDRFIYSLSIPLIGRSASKTISKYFKGNANEFFVTWGKKDFKWYKLDDFGAAMHKSMNQFYKENCELICCLQSYMYFNIVAKDWTEDDRKNPNISHKTFVITGSITHFKNRKELQEKIESLGGKVSGSISKKTSYLINNDSESESSKNKKAKELGIPIITEEQLLAMLEV